MNNLGVLYENGRGLRVDPTAALIWYEKAAAEGDSHAQASVDKLKAAGR
jgi:hypothetical protein